MRYADIKPFDINNDFIEIEGYPNYYVNSKGEIYSIKSKRMLKPYKDSKGYLQVDLFNNGSRKPRKVHKIVAQMFLDRGDGMECVNHIDGDKANNSVENLEWCTFKYNTRHAIEKGLKKAFPNNLREEKKVAQYDLEGRLLNVYNSMREASRITNTPQPNISKVCMGERKSANKFIWREVV